MEELPGTEVDLMGKWMIAATVLVPVYLELYMVYIPLNSFYRWLGKLHAKGGVKKNGSLPK